jgi:hypothetical protein
LRCVSACSLRWLPFLLVPYGYNRCSRWNITYLLDSDIVFRLTITYVYTICMNIMHIVVAVIEPGAETVELKIFGFYNVLSRSRRSLCDSLDLSRKRDPSVLPRIWESPKGSRLSFHWSEGFWILHAFHLKRCYHVQYQRIVRNFSLVFSIRGHARISSSPRTTRLQFYPNIHCTKLRDIFCLFKRKVETGRETCASNLAKFLDGSNGSTLVHLSYLQQVLGILSHVDFHANSS